MPIAQLGQGHLNAINAIFMAAQQGHVDILQLLINAGADVNVHNNNGMTALQLAIQHNNPAVVQALLNAGANPNLNVNNQNLNNEDNVDEDDDDFDEDYPEDDMLVQMMLNAGANPNLNVNNQQNPNANNLLQLAIENDDLAVVLPALILAGNDINVNNQNPNEVDPFFFNEGNPDID